MDPKPILLTEALFSNVGGVATLVGDPPNVMISGAGGFSYLDFISNLAPVVIVCVLASLVAFKILFASKAKEENSKIREKANSQETFLKRRPSEEIEDWGLLKRSGSVLGLVIFLFVIHHEIGLMPAAVALTGAAVLLLITRPEMERIVERVK